MKSGAAAEEQEHIQLRSGETQQVGGGYYPHRSTAELTMGVVPAIGNDGENFKYQYSTDGSNWQDLSTDISSVLRSHFLMLPKKRQRPVEIELKAAVAVAAEEQAMVLALQQKVTTRLQDSTKVLWIMFSCTITTIQKL